MSDDQPWRNLRLPDAEAGPAGNHAYYNKSWALVIGINDYEGRRLVNARNDAEKFAALLKEKYGFEEVISLLDKDASRENILRYLWEDLKDRVGAEDRLIIFFAGHGESQPSKDGKRIGYIIPQDARKGTIIDHIKMNELREACDIIPAKHILIILDCCFSGVAAIATCWRGKTDETPPKKLNDAYLRKLTEKKAYQIMTAGEVDQPTPDSSLTPGHSAFTAALLDGLRGDADSDGNGLITATELYNYIQPRVLSETSKDGAKGQMPFLDYIKGSDIYHPGNFVFLLPNVALDQREEKKSNKVNYEGDELKEGHWLKEIKDKFPIIAIFLIMVIAAIYIIHPFPPNPPDIAENAYSPPDIDPNMPEDLILTYSSIQEMVWDENFEDALNALDDISEMYPEYNKTTSFEKGWALNKKGYWEAFNHPEEANNTFEMAWKELENAAAADPNNHISPPNVFIFNEKANTYYYKANASKDPYYYGLAIKWNNAAIKLDPYRDFVWHDRGRIMLDQNKCEEAIEAFDKAIQLNPSDTESKDLKEEAIQCA